MKKKKGKLWCYVIYALFVYLALVAVGLNSKDGMVLGILTLYSGIGVVIFDHLILGFFISQWRLLFYEIMTIVTILSVLGGFLMGWRDLYQLYFIFL